MDEGRGGGFQGVPGMSASTVGTSEMVEATDVLLGMRDGAWHEGVPVLNTPNCLVPVMVLTFGRHSGWDFGHWV